MANPATVRSPWSSFKRLRISPTPVASRTPRAAFISTSRLQLQDGVTPTDTTSATPDQNAVAKHQPGTKDLYTPPTPLPSADVPEDEMNGQDRMKIQTGMRNFLFNMARARGIEVPDDLYPVTKHEARLPRGVQTLYLAPLRREPTHSIPVCNLQLRSYSPRNLETMADFALRAAYYLGLPAKGPVPLPRITERWTVPRSVFVHKKAQENWERITSRRLIQIQDGHPDVVKKWLTFIRKWEWYGIGMRAEVWENEGVDDWQKMGQSEAEMKAAEDSTTWELFGRRVDLAGEQAVGEYMDSLGFAGSAQKPPSGDAKSSSKSAKPAAEGKPKKAEGKKTKAKAAQKA